MVVPLIFYFRTPPYILDPANPFNDAAPHRSVKGDYSRIQERGQKLLDNLRLETQ